MGSEGAGAMVASTLAKTSASKFWKCKCNKKIFWIAKIHDTTRRTFICKQGGQPEEHDG